MTLDSEMPKNKRSYKNCSVYGCLNTTLNRNELTFFKLPVNINRRNKWLELIQREDLKGKPSTHYCVCEDHFDDESILRSPNRKVLKQKSIPKLLLPNKQYKNEGCQATVETIDSEAQYDLVKTNIILQADTLSISSLRRRKIKNDSQDCKEKLNTTAESEFNIFIKLCDQFLNKCLAHIVKEQTKLKFNCLGSKIE